MQRYRSRSRSRSRVRRSKHYDDPRDRRRERRLPAPSGLLVRNISLNASPEDLRAPFERYGPIKDVYLPKNYYTGEARGFGFVKFRYPEDAAEAKGQLNHTLIGGQEIKIVFAEENRKTPQEMRRVSRVSSRGRYRRRSPSWSPRKQYHSESRSPSPARRESRSKLTKRDIKNSRLVKGNEKGMKSQRLLALYLSMPSKIITDKFQFEEILFYFASQLVRFVHIGQPTDLLKKEHRAYSWPKKEIIFKEQGLSKL